MRRAMRIVLLGVLAALMPAARADGPYVNHAYRFGFTPPAGWVRKTHPDALVVFMEPESGRPAARGRRESDEEFLARLKRDVDAPLGTATLRANLVVTARSAGTMSLDQCAREARTRAVDRRAYRILGERRRRLGGAPAVERTIRIALPGSPVVQTREVFCVQNGRLLTLTLAAPPAGFSRYAAEFEKALASFVWR